MSKVDIGILYVVSTPIGNLSDISFRSLEIFKTVDYILCEDTRITKKIFDKYNISVKMISYNEKNEINKISKIINDLKLCDVMRHNVPDEEKVYSWWSYRNRDWRKSNRGRRLDHIWVTKDLLRYHKSLEIYKAARDWERPSDHVPVMIEL